MFASLLECSNDAMWVFTPGWSELVYVNSAYEDIFGGAVEELEADSMSFLENVHPDDRDAVMDRMDVLAGGESVEFEFRVDPSTDFTTWVWVDGKALRDADGDVEYLAGHARDVTERKRYEKDLERYHDQLEQSNESLKEFAYVASHDLQEPLRMVSSYIDLLEVEYGDELDDEASEYMQFAVDGAQRMKAMIDSLLTYSRVHTEDQEVESVDATDAVNDVTHDLHHRIEETDATVVVDDLPTVEAYPDQLAQVFQNLLKNAIDHAAESGPPRIEITATERSDAVEFAVADDGPGIPVADQEDVFDIFRQAGHHDEDGSNSGIGLSIVKRIVERHGGEVWIDSAEGEGATFRFTVPQDGPQPIAEEDPA